MRSACSHNIGCPMLSPPPCTPYTAHAQLSNSPKIAQYGCDGAGQLTRSHTEASGDTKDLQSTPSRPQREMNTSSTALKVLRARTHRPCRAALCCRPQPAGPWLPWSRLHAGCLPMTCAQNSL